MIDNSFTHLVDERGFLSKEGRIYVDDRFGKEIATLLRMGTTPNQVRIIASVLKNYIGEKVIDRMKDIASGE